MRLTEEAMRIRRETIIQASVRLFSARGIENVPMSTIAKEAKVSENTIYRYFENKEKLVLEAFVNLWDSIMKSVEQIVEDVPNYDALTGYEQVRIWIDGFRILYQEDREFVLFSYDAKLYLLHQGVRLDQFQQDMLMQSFRGKCMEALDKGKRDGSIPVQESSENLFYAIWGAIRGYVVKIVIYGALYGENSPWESRYDVMKQGILSALQAGWNPVD